MGKYFGTDGIRGEADVVLTTDLAYRVGKALRGLPSKTVVIATDTRISRDSLQNAIAKGAMAVGLDVIIGGITPTPCLVYYAFQKKITGVMITASHNPYKDNGIKVLNQGIKMDESLEALIENLIDEECEECNTGKLITSEDIKIEYLALLGKYACKSDKRIAIDTANGATYLTAPKAFSHCPNLFVMANEPNGVNINNNVGSTHLQAISEFAQANKCDIGFAFDGDGDRVLVVDGEGNKYDGDMIIYVIAKYLYQHKQLNDNKVVFTIMSNLGLINNLRKFGIDVVETNVGDKHVLYELLTNNYSIGGENSGHIIMPQILCTGDGTLVALYLLRILEEMQMSFSELLEGVEMYADRMVNLRVADKRIILQENIVNRINDIHKELAKDGKVIVRPSGTEDLIRISVMAPTADIVNRYVDELVGLISQKEGL